MAAATRQRHLHVPYTVQAFTGSQPAGYMVGPVMDDHSSGANLQGYSGAYRGPVINGASGVDLLHGHVAGPGHAIVIAGQMAPSGPYYTGAGPAPLGSGFSGTPMHQPASMPPAPPPQPSAPGQQSQSDVEKPIGYGAFGVVWAVTDPRDGKRIAIKKLPNVFQSVTSCRRVYRELKMLCTFKHDNVLSAVDILKPPESQGFTEIYIATEYMQSDLHRIIVSPQPLSVDHIKVFIYQILRGLKYLHSANILHRDIKPGNLLINANCLLKICDFGLARVGEPDPSAHLTQEVVTQYYRAPELLMGARHYTGAVDIWSVGCILAELLSRRILFQAQSPLQQLDLIVDLLGTPTIDDIKSACEPAKLHVLRKGLRQSKISMLYSLSKDCDHDVINLLSAIFVFNPERRISAATALTHIYLEDGRLRYHTCMCRCCPAPDGRRYTDCMEPTCPTPFHFTFEDDLTNVPVIREKVNKLYKEVQSRQIETLQLNVSSPIYKRFIKSQCAQPSELPPSPHVWA